MEQYGAIKYFFNFLDGLCFLCSHLKFFPLFIVGGIPQDGQCNQKASSGHSWWSSVFGMVRVESTYALPEPLEIKIRIAALCVVGI